MNLRDQESEECECESRDPSLHGDASIRKSSFRHGDVQEGGAAKLPKTAPACDKEEITVVNMFTSQY